MDHFLRPIPVPRYHIDTAPPEGQIWGMDARQLDHVFVTVLARRWCTCCGLFQVKRGRDWPSATRCPNDAPAAEINRLHAQEPA